MTSTHDTRRRCSASAAVVVALAMMLAPALTPAALAYDAEASGPDASARFILPDWDPLDDGIDPFDESLIPRRAMEHPREMDFFFDVASIVYGARCLFGGASFVGCAASYGWGTYRTVSSWGGDSLPDCYGRNRSGAQYYDCNLCAAGCSL